MVASQRIAKYESDEGFVELYFDEIGRQRQCVEFDVIQVIRMNPKPARVTVYDYYETSKYGHVMRKQDFLYAKAKTQISCAVTAQLICVFVFAYKTGFFYMRKQRRSSVVQLPYS